MSIIETDTSYMKRDVGEIIQYISELKSAASELETLLGSLHSGWVGVAATTYETSLRGDLDRLKNLTALLEELNKGTDFARSKYESCENNISEIISSITI